MVAQYRYEPIMDPWGLPPLRWYGVDFSSPTLTTIHLFVRKDLTTASRDPQGLKLAEAFPMRYSIKGFGKVDAADVHGISRILQDIQGLVPYRGKEVRGATPLEPPKLHWVRRDLTAELVQHYGL